MKTTRSRIVLYFVWQYKDVFVHEHWRLSGNNWVWCFSAVSAHTCMHGRRLWAGDASPKNVRGDAGSMLRKPSSFVSSTSRRMTDEASWWLFCVENNIIHIWAYPPYWRRKKSKNSRKYSDVATYERKCSAAFSVFLCISETPALAQTVGLFLPLRSFSFDKAGRTSAPISKTWHLPRWVIISFWSRSNTNRVEKRRNKETFLPSPPNHTSHISLQQNMYQHSSCQQSAGDPAQSTKQIAPLRR